MTHRTPLRVDTGSRRTQLAVATAYHADASKVDAAKYSVYKAGQLCSNCGQIQGQDGNLWRPCKIFPGRSVAAVLIVYGVSELSGVA